MLMKEIVELLIINHELVDKGLVRDVFLLRYFAQFFEGTLISLQWGSRVEDSLDVGLVGQVGSWIPRKEYEYYSY